MCKAGRWTYAEQRQLIAGLKAGKPAETIARNLRRSASSTFMKATELGFDLSPPEYTPEQMAALTEAARLREISTRCQELADVAGIRDISNRLVALSQEYVETAWVVEARAGLPLTRVIKNIK